MRREHFCSYPGITAWSSKHLHLLHKWISTLFNGRLGSKCTTFLSLKAYYVSNISDCSKHTALVTLAQHNNEFSWAENLKCDFFWETQISSLLQTHDKWWTSSNDPNLSTFYFSHWWWSCGKFKQHGPWRYWCNREEKSFLGIVSSLPWQFRLKIPMTR